MNAQFTRITTKDVLGLVYVALSAVVGGWVAKLSMESPSGQKTENYGWLGQVPALRRWIGERTIKDLLEQEYSLTNQAYEATIGIALTDMRRDRLGIIEQRIAELPARVNQHWAKLLTDLITTNGTCYDGQNFFSATHAEGESGTQLNLLTATQVTTLNVSSATRPTAIEMADILVDLIGYFQTYVDDQGEPMNEDAKGFQLLCGTMSIYQAAIQAITAQSLSNSGPVDNPLKSLEADGVNVAAALNPRLSAVTTAFTFHRTDTAVKPFIRQNEKDATVDVLDENSDHAFKNKEILVGVDVMRAAGYAIWQTSQYCTMS